jgi:hypothetical protein
MANYMDGMEGGKHNSDDTETNNTVPSFTVSLTFESVDAKTPQEAVNKIVSWIKGEDGLGGLEVMIFDVQNEITLDKFTVDLSEDEEDQVLPNNL